VCHRLSVGLSRASPPLFSKSVSNCKASTRAAAACRAEKTQPKLAGTHGPHSEAAPRLGWVGFMNPHVVPTATSASWQPPTRSPLFSRHGLSNSPKNFYRISCFFPFPNSTWVDRRRPRSDWRAWAHGARITLLAGREQQAAGPAGAAEPQVRRASAARGAPLGCRRAPAVARRRRAFTCAGRRGGARSQGRQAAA